MQEYRTRLSENGRVVIPAQCRKELHFEPGEELILRVEDGALHLFSLKQALKHAQHVVQQHTKNGSLLQTLDTLRKEDNK